MLGEGGSDPLTTTPRLFAKTRLMTRTSKPRNPTSAMAPTPMPAFAPVDRPAPELAGIGVPVAVAVAAFVVVVVAAALAAPDTPVELVGVWLVLAALSVDVKNISACVALPSMAATRSLFGQPAVLAHALLEQHPIKGVLSAEHRYHAAPVLVQLCAEMPW